MSPEPQKNLSNSRSAVRSSQAADAFEAHNGFCRIQDSASSIMLSVAGRRLATPSSKRLVSSPKAEYKILARSGFQVAESFSGFYHC